MEYSFIIPVYNCKEYLPGCVESILAAQAPSCEIILVDDGSTDGSGAVCDALASQYPVIRVVHQSNSGASAARNRGIQEAQGEKILFLDADDSIDSATLFTILSDPRCDQADLTIFGLTFDYYHKGRCYRRDPLFYAYDGLLSRQNWGRAFTELYEQNSLSPVWNKVFKRDILMQNRLELNPDMFLYEDLEFVLRYLQHCDAIWNVPRAVYRYRQAEDEGNAKRRLAQIDSIPNLLLPIETALTELLLKNPFIPLQQKDAVLQRLYLVLAGGKIGACNTKETGRICDDFTKWMNDREVRIPKESQSFANQLLNRHVIQLILRREYVHIRHKLAVLVKSFGIYQRRKG